MKKGTEKTIKNIFYKTNPRGGISLIVLVITIIVVIILAAAVIISLQNNNPMVEANKARINSDVANMQAIFTNTVGKIMAENQDVVEIEAVQLNSVTSGKRKTTGEATYKIVGTDGTPVVQGKIKFSTEKSERTIYCTGKELPLYSGETIWYVDKQGLLSVEVGGVSYGEGTNTDNPPPVEEGEEIAESDNPMLKTRATPNDRTTDFHAEEYRTKISKVKFATADKVQSNKIASWDVSEAKDKSVIAWVESDGAEGYILTIAGKSKIVANTNSLGLFYNFTNLKEIENLELLDTSNVTNMSCMFQDCRRLASLDLNNFNTSGVTSMVNMFKGCSSLTSIDLSKLKTENVTIMSMMFNDCINLTNINFGDFNTSSVTNMQGMFVGCSNLTSLDLSSFNTSKVKYIGVMFMNCNKLTTTITINGENIQQSESGYGRIFKGAATDSTAKITVNYTAETSDLVDKMIATKSENSNVVKGVQI